MPLASHVTWGWESKPCGPHPEATFSHSSRRHLKKWADCHAAGCCCFNHVLAQFYHEQACSGPYCWSYGWAGEGEVQSQVGCGAHVGVLCRVDNTCGLPANGVRKHDATGQDSFIWGQQCAENGSFLVVANGCHVNTVSRTCMVHLQQSKRAKAVCISYMYV